AAPRSFPFAEAFVGGFKSRRRHFVAFCVDGSGRDNVGKDLQRLNQVGFVGLYFFGIRLVELVGHSREPVRPKSATTKLVEAVVQDYGNGGKTSEHHLVAEPNQQQHESNRANQEQHRRQESRDLVVARNTDIGTTAF